MTDPLQQIFARRQHYWANGFRPIEVWSPDAKVNDTGKPLNSPGKQPRGQWRRAAQCTPPEAVTKTTHPTAANTGISCENEIIAVDVDVPVQDLADQVVAGAETRFGHTPLVRIGMAPKILLVYRAPPEAFAKVQTPELFLPDGTKLKVELLANGQQFVADGIHPDTGKPYYWTVVGPEDVPRAELPQVTEADARSFITEAEALLRAAGAKEKAKEKTGNGRDSASTQNMARPPNPPPRQPAGDFFREVNSAALADNAAWAPILFPTGHREAGTGAWRVSSADLGRSLEEDISIHPAGVWDFGEERPRSPIDLVTDYGDAGKPLNAALWLCEQLRIDPKSLGYQAGRARSPAEDTPRPEALPAGIALTDFWAYMPMHNYIYVPTRAMWPAGSINSRLPPINVGVDDEGEPISIKASTWIDQNRPVEQMTWAPGLPEIIENRLLYEGGWIDRPGVRCFNQYLAPAIIPGDARRADRWLDHVRLVYPDDAEHLVCWLAQRVQRPQEKINHAIVLGGSPGIGKDTLLEPVKRAIGPWNFQEALPAQVLGRFNGFLKSVILRINEAHDLGDFDRFQFYDRMKAYAAAPPDMLRVDEKHLREYSIVNVCGIVITTNHKTDGIHLPGEDRRHFVAWSDLTKDDKRFADGYWARIYAYYEGGGAEAVAAYLRQLDISLFDPKAPPQKTAAFWAIVDANRSPEEPELADILDNLGNPAVITLSRIQNNAEGDFAEWLKDRRNRRIIPHRMEKCGYVPVRNPDADDGLWKVFGKRQAIYARENLSLRDQIAEARKLARSV